MGQVIGCELCKPPGEKTSSMDKPELDSFRKEAAGEIMPCGNSSTSGNLEFLSKVQLFQRLPLDQHPALAAASVAVHYSKGQTIIRQGEEGNEFFIIVAGEASVTIENKKVASLRTGDYFGENALLRNEPRTATILADTVLEALKITRDKFEALGLNQKLVFPNRRAVAGGGAKAIEAKPPSPKTQAERKLIMDALKANKNLQSIAELNDTKCTKMIEVAWKENIPSGKDVIVEGDMDADFFYIVEDGLFEVITALPPQKGQSAEAMIWNSTASETVGIVQRGGSFGELALIYLAPRAASVRAKADSVVWVIDRHNFKSILAKSAEEIAKENCKYLNKVDLFHPLQLEEKLAIARALTEVVFSKDETIFEQGEGGQEMYILLEGQAAVIKDGKEALRMKATPDSAEIFGERALLESAPRAATVQIKSDTAKALCMDKKSFEMLLGPLDVLRKRGSSGPSMVKQAVQPAPTPKAKPANTKILYKDLTQLGLLGCGGFGAVSLVEHKTTKETYALKQLSKGYVVKCGMQQGIMSEKTIQYMCESIFIIRLHETFNTKDSLYFLLELALGGELYATYNKKGFFGSMKHAQFYTSGVVFAFDHLHEKKVIFRDLKPENVLMNELGQVKLTDMGLAKVVVGKTYTTCGTPDYFAPEILKSEGHNGAVDWWTLGILIYELMCGNPPFESPTPMQTYAKINKGIGKVLFPTRCKGPCEDLVKNLCKANPADRIAMKKGGSDNVKRHVWYRNFDWQAMGELGMDPPYKPAVKNKKDAGNFSCRKEDMPPQEEYQDDGSGWDKDFATST